LNHAVDSVRILIFFAGVSVESAKDTVNVADVGVVGIRVDDKRYLRRGILLETNLVGKVGKVEQLGAAKKKKPFFLGDPLAIAYFRIQLGLHYFSCR
jgi:hypothetical protein